MGGELQGGREERSEVEGRKRRSEKEKKRKEK